MNPRVLVSAPLVCFCALSFAIWAFAQNPNSQIGREIAIPTYLRDGDEFNLPAKQLIEFEQVAEKLSHGLPRLGNC
jgi:hypothetical protein